MNSDPLFFGFYTRNSPYEREYRAIKVCYEALGLDHEYVAMDSRGSWLANCAAKSEIVADVLRRHPGRKCVYVDVDSVIIHRPQMFWELQCDIAAVMFDTNILLSGVVMFNSWPKTLEVVDLWVKLCKQYPKTLPDGREAWDQRILQWAIEQTGGLHFMQLPPSYNYMVELSQKRYPGVNPVILATRGALRYQDQMDETK